MTGRPQKFVQWLQEAQDLRASGLPWEQVTSTLQAKGYRDATLFKVRARIDPEFKERCVLHSRRCKEKYMARLAENGIAIGMKPAISEELQAVIPHLIRRGLSRYGIAKKLGLSATTLRRCFPDWNNCEYVPPKLFAEKTSEEDANPPRVVSDEELATYLDMFKDLLAQPQRETHVDAKPSQDKPPKIEPIKPRFIEAERIVAEEKDVRATTYVKRNYKFGMPIQRQPRIRNVTGFLLGDPDHPSMRVATNQRSHSE